MTGGLRNFLGTVCIYLPVCVSTYVCMYCMYVWKDEEFSHIDADVVVSIGHLTPSNNIPVGPTRCVVLLQAISIQSILTGVGICSETYQKVFFLNYVSGALKIRGL